MGLIYKKALRLSPVARKDTTVGEMVNVLQVNTQVFETLAPFINMSWSIPLQLIICTVMLWSYLGVASLAGLLPIFFNIPFQIKVAADNKNNQIAKFKYADSRIRLTNEVLNGMKVLKFYAWETSFRDKIESIRKFELNYLKKINYLAITLQVSGSLTSFFISTLPFLVYIYMNDENELTASAAFVSITLLNLIKFPLWLLPMLAFNLIQCNVGVQRVTNFLLKDEIDNTSITHHKTDSTISFRDVDLSWDENKDEGALKNLNFQVKKNELIAGKNKSFIYLIIFHFNSIFVI
jgi:ABC-type bacteriocin/lantibiotic exporter with double-glycine peptidase domain